MPRLLGIQTQGDQELHVASLPTLEHKAIPEEKDEMNTAYCHHCLCVTETLLLPLSSGHVGNCCTICRATRKGRPFVTRAEYERSIGSPKPQEAVGDKTQANRSL